ncbi:hypothetical protein [Pararhizobium sp.]|uniref:hypothetical protein n=1 Tax=Pararhizobium sp. TaxID=1977563 RepID=UPI00272553DA|nr:hypothetical protein [Pararhizobium sp.]MDO9418477.1 hypothetical protein [Pararhizobium sp.]
MNDEQIEDLLAFRRQRYLKRGRSLSLGEFQRMYGLSDDEAKRIFQTFGPCYQDLNALMTAKAARNR